MDALTGQWWRCDPCQVAWWGHGTCWVCDTTTRVRASRPPEFMSTGCALPVIRPQWSTHP